MVRKSHLSSTCKQISGINCICKILKLDFIPADQHIFANSDSSPTDVDTLLLFYWCINLLKTRTWSINQLVKHQIVSSDEDKGPVDKTAFSLACRHAWAIKSLKSCITLAVVHTMVDLVQRKIWAKSPLVRLWNVAGITLMFNQIFDFCLTFY